MLRIFIDSNIYLRFFAYADDTFEELEKFHALAVAEKIELYVTEQVKDEVRRNRESEIARAVARFQKSATSPEIPRFALHLAEAKALQKEGKKLSDAKSALAAKIAEEIEKSELRADQLIDQLADVAVDVDVSKKVLEAARLRRELGNPPGKPESLGDQINWECLLSTVPNASDLHVVTNDDDFFSKLGTDQPSKFLREEWEVKNGGDLLMYRSLSGFAKKHFPDIKLPIDVIKADAIGKLVKSGNFSATHKQISKLKEISDQLTYDDAAVLFQAMIDNQQISWIADDDDVKEFYVELYNKYYPKTSIEMDEELCKVAKYLDVQF